METFEQIPHHTITLLDDGVQEKLQIVVRLPGVSSVSEFVVRILPQTLKLHAPGRYNLEVNLDAVVEDKAEELKFVKNRNELKAILRVVSRLTTPSGLPRQQTNADSAPAAAKPSLHESFLMDATKLAMRSKSRPSGGKGSKAAKEAKASRGTPPVKVEELDPPPESQGEWERPRRRSKKHGPGFVPAAAASDEGASAPDAKRQSDQAGRTEDAGNTTSATVPGKEGSSGGATDHLEIADEAAKLLREEGVQSQEVLEEANGLHTQEIRPSDPGTAHASTEAPQEPRKEILEESTTDEMQYGMATRRANYEAATQSLERATEAMAAGDPIKAFHWAKKAAKLFPGDNEDVQQLLWACEDSLQREGNGNAGTAPGKPVKRESDGAESEAANNAQSPWTPRKTNEERSPKNGKRFRAEEKSSGEGVGEPAPESSGASQSGFPKRPSNGKSHPRKQRHKQKQQKPSPQGASSKGKANGEPQSPHSHISEENAEEASYASAEDAKESSSHGVRARVLQAVFLWEQSMKPKGRAVRSFAVLLTNLVFAVVYLSVIAERVWCYMRRTAPNLIANTVSWFGFHRHYRSLVVAKRKSQMLHYCLSTLSVTIYALLCYLGVRISWGLLWLSWATLMACASSALFILDFVFWRPAFWSSLTISLFMRYSSLLFGRAKLAFHVSCFWGWPLMMWTMKGGVVGLLGLPLAFFATIWNISHVELVLALCCTRMVFSWLHWGFMRLACLFLGTVYLVIIQRIGGPKPEVKASSKVEVPDGAEGEVARVLQAEDLYEVLMVPKEADAETLRKAKRIMSLATHPDKLHQAVGSNEAFARVTEAHDILSDPAKREAYDEELKMKAILEEMQREAEQAGVSGASTQINEEDGIAVMCPGCGLEHCGIFVDRPVSKARYCGECKIYHPAKEGDGWHESSTSLFRRKVKMYICMQGRVVDMTHWANCALKMSKNAAAVATDTHKAPYSFLGDDSPARPNNKKTKGRRRR